MMDTREYIKLWRPARVFWFCWLLAFLAGIVPPFEAIFMNVWYARWLYALFLPAEVYGHFRPNYRIDGDGRKIDLGGDTLSEWMQNIASWSPDSVPWWKGFKVIPVGFAVAISGHLAWTVSYWEGQWDRWVIGVPFGAANALWLIYHWSRRGKYG
jgi:hypothetical protein